ncbi:MAG: glycosyltransferase family 4 protein [Pseudomonadota bacterium]
MSVRVAVVISHPIQHFCPQYASWSKLPGIDLKVFFAARIGMEAYFDPDFGQDVQWKGLDLDFEHAFLPGAEDRTTSTMIEAEGLDGALDAFAPDMVVIYGYTVPLQQRAIRWASARGVKIAMISDAELRTPRPVWKRLAKEVLIRRWIAKIDVFLTVGDGNEAYYRAYGARDRQFFRSGFPIDTAKLDAAFMEKPARRERLRAELGIPQEHLVLMSVGKLIPRKRPADMVDLARRMGGQGVTVILAGSGPEEAALKKRAGSQGPGGVIFAGFVQPVELIDFYMATDVYMHPAEVDRHPLSVTEGTYCGAPAIVSERIGSYGPSDDLQPGVNGFVHDLGDIDAMSAAVTRLKDQDLYRRMSEASVRISRATQVRAHGGALQAAILSLGLEERRA